MFGMQAYMVNGKMFAALGERGALLKLPREQRAALLASREVETTTMSTGVAFGEWVTLPAASVSQDRERVLGLIRQSFDYVQTAPPPARPQREQRRFRKRQF